MSFSFTIPRSLLALGLIAGAFLVLGLLWAPQAEAFVVCGNNICEPNGHPFGEDCEICPQDCGGSCSICGNGFCTSPETCSSCAADCGTCPGQTDTDGDGVYDNTDNCVNTPNPGQADCDGDGDGDACDSSNASWSAISGTYGPCYIYGYSTGTSADVWVVNQEKYEDVSSCGNPDTWFGAGSYAYYCSWTNDVYQCCGSWIGYFQCNSYYNFYQCQY